MDWREIYARRLCTPEQASALIAPGDRIFAGGAGSFPAVLIDAVSDRAELRGIPVVTVVNGTESRALSDPACFARTPYGSTQKERIRFALCCAAVILRRFLFQGSKWLCYPRQQRNGKGGERKRPAAVAVIPLS